MNWSADQNHLVFTLLDDSGQAIMGEVIRDTEAGWNGYDLCAPEAAKRHLGLFDTADSAKVAVASSVHGRHLQ